MRSYRSRRRRKRIGKNKTAMNVFIVVFCVIACIVLTVMFGNYLKDKAASTKPGIDDTTDPEQTTEQPVTDTQTPSDIHTVEAGYLDLSISPDSEKSASDVAEEFFASSYTAASFRLRDGEGSLLYTSQVATTLGQKSASSLDIKELVELLSQRDIYTVGCFDSVAFGDDVTQDMYAVVLSYETALIRELFEMGVDEILLTSLPTDREGLDSAFDYLKKLKNELSDECRIGLSIPYTLLLDEDIIETAKNVSLAADFIAVDMSGLGGEDPYKATDEFVKASELYISRYNMRMLIPMSETATITKQINALSANAVYNWQIIK